ncbi:MAG: hypothetical protein LBU87_03920 [Lactobacillales bacterium]|jgi:hypothetical protein|nr:hypothetical protein [Lactobacillales bacterium]
MQAKERFKDLKNFLGVFKSKRIKKIRKNKSKKIKTKGISCAGEKISTMIVKKKKYRPIASGIKIFFFFILFIKNARRKDTQNIGKETIKRDKIVKRGVIQS